MTTSDLLTLGGATIIVTIVVEIIKRAAAFSDANSARFGPLLAVGTGVVATVLAAFASPAPDYANAVLTGLLAGAAASGVYSFAKAPTKGDG